MFTENQVRQFYVATGTTADVIAPIQVDSTHKATDLSAKSAGACQFIINAAGDEAYLEYKGPSDDGVQRSDLIKKCNVMDVRLTDAADLMHKMKKVEVALDSNVSATAIVGQDYVLTVNIKNYLTSGYDSIKSKFGAARAFTTTASDLYKNLAISLAKNFAFEPAKLIKITLKGDSNNTEITKKTKVTDLSSITATGIVLEEVEQPWRRGAAPQEFVDFEVIPHTITANDLERVWGTVTDITAANTNKLPNSKKVADMEWFFHKERGDRYGDTCWPLSIDTTYQVDPSNASGYSFIDIHFFFEGNSHNVGKSEKTLTIVGTKTLLKKLFGSPATTGQSATAATGLYAFLEGTGTNIVTSASW